jgi:hypothetical protein
LHRIYQAFLLSDDQSGSLIFILKSDYSHFHYEIKYNIEKGFYKKLESIDEYKFVED